MKIGPNKTFLIVNILLLSSLQMLTFAQTESPSQTVDTSVTTSTNTFKIIPQNEAEYLLDSCDVTLVKSAYEAYINAYAQKASTDPTSTINMDSYRKQLQIEINTILLSCLQKELSMKDCTKGGCTYNTMELVLIEQELFFKYFGYQFNENETSLWTEDGLKKAKEMYQNKLEQCYYELLRKCNCDIDGILSLWGTLNFDEFTTYRLDDNRVERLNRDIQEYLLYCYSIKLDKCGCDIDCLERLLGQAMSDTSGLKNSDQDDLTNKILSRYQQCIEKKVSESMNIDELVGLVLDNQNLEFKKTTIYDNYGLIIPIITRINALYKLNINIADPYFLKCCDRSIYLKNLYLLIKQYEKENKIDQLKDHQIVKDPYTYCRITMLDQNTKGCSVDSFCQSLVCQGLYGGYGGDAYEQTIKDPKEKLYLSYYKTRIKECSGLEVKIEDLVEYCSIRNTNRNWTDFNNKYPSSSITNVTVDENNNVSNNNKELLPIETVPFSPEGGSINNKNKRPSESEISITNEKDESTPAITEAFNNLEKILLEKEKDQNNSKEKMIQIIVSGSGDDANTSNSKIYKIESLNLSDIEKISKENNTSIIIPLLINAGPDTASSNSSIYKREGIVVVGTDGKNSILVDGNTTAKIYLDVSIGKEGISAGTNSSKIIVVKLLPSDISKGLPSGTKIPIRAGPNSASSNSSTRKWCFRVNVNDNYQIAELVGPSVYIKDQNTSCFYINNTDFALNYISMIKYNDTIAYDFSVEEYSKILGLIPVNYLRTITVDAVDGKILKIQKPFWAFMVNETEIPNTFNY